MELMQASRQWASRPDDERFVNLSEMFDRFHTQRLQSKAAVVSTRSFQLQPVGESHDAMGVVGPSGAVFNPTHYAFGQLSQLSESPAGYLRTLPSEIAADCLNCKLRQRSAEDVGLLLQKNGESIVRAATGPKYGRIWNDDVIAGVQKHFGDGTDGSWRVPGVFGKPVDVTRENTTLFGGDRDMFVFLADESNRVEVPNRRNGASGTMARGFFCWNSEVGASTFGFGTFLFDYVCGNRIVWGATGYQQIRMRHTVSAPDRFWEEVIPALERYRHDSSQSILTAIAAAKAARLKDIDSFLATRFGKRMVTPLKSIHMLEEQRPIESVWDVTTAVTAYARSIKFQDERVQLERAGGELLAFDMGKNRELVLA